MKENLSYHKLSDTVAYIEGWMQKGS